MKATIAFKLTNTVDTTKGEAVDLPGWAKYGSIQIPTIVTGTVGFEFIAAANVTAAKIVADQDTDWTPVETAIDSVGNLVTIHNGTGAIVVGISALIKALGLGMIRVVTGGTQNAVTSWYVHFTD
jgi:hypothetical protein